MDFLKSGLKTVLGAPEPGQLPSGAETVERLVERINSSTLLEDRRDACRALKAMSRKYRVEVGAQSLDTLKQVLELDRGDPETVRYALDTLDNVVSPAQFEEEERAARPGVAEQFSEMLLKEPRAVQRLLAVLDEPDSHVRLAAVRLLGSLLANRARHVQELVLREPRGVAQVMDLLGDAREAVRNEALLLLLKLTQGNASIQKIVAFENAFERLLDIVAAEGHADGGIVVEDCLLLALNLLRNNASNVSFFKEGSFVRRLLPLLAAAEAPDEGWAAQRAANVLCALRLLRALCSPALPAPTLRACQDELRARGLLRALCELLMASGVPADVLTESIAAVGEAVRGCGASQEALGAVLAPTEPPRPAVLVLLMSLVNDKQPLALRLAALYCFQCYVRGNEAAQAALVQTLLPAQADAGGLSAGQLLCGGLFAPDALTCWLAAAALQHALLANPRQKERLLRVLLATGASREPVSLLRQCTLLLQQTAKLQAKVGLLMLLAQWCLHCPAAAGAFLAVPGGVGFLVNQASSNDHGDDEALPQGLAALLLAVLVRFNDDSVEAYAGDALRQLAARRVGADAFAAKLQELAKHEAYCRAAKQPQPRAAQAPELLLDYDFCRTMRAEEPELARALAPRAASPAPAPAPLAQYKALIRQQDLRLQELVAQLAELAAHHAALQGSLADALQAQELLRDENTLLRAQAAANERRDQELAAAQEELRALRGDHEDLLLLLADEDARAAAYRRRLLALGQAVDAPPEP